MARRKTADKVSTFPKFVIVLAPGSVAAFSQQYFIEIFLLKKVITNNQVDSNPGVKATKGGSYNSLTQKHLTPKRVVKVSLNRSTKTCTMRDDQFK